MRLAMFNRIDKQEPMLRENLTTGKKPPAGKGSGNRNLCEEESCQITRGAGSRSSEKKLLDSGPAQK